MHFWMVAPWRHAGLRYKSSKLAENNRHIPQQGPRQCIKTGTETTNNRCSCHMAHTRSTEPLFFGQEQSAHTHTQNVDFGITFVNRHLFAHLFSLPNFYGSPSQLALRSPTTWTASPKWSRLTETLEQRVVREVFVSIIVWYSVTAHH